MEPEVQFITLSLTHMWYIALLFIGVYEWSDVFFDTSQGLLNHTLSLAYVIVLRLCIEFFSKKKERKKKKRKEKGAFLYFFLI